MVFFVCEGCNETLKKAQVDKHCRSCRNCHAVTCVDCSVTFYGDDYAMHTSCISEAEKYEKSLYKAKPGANKPKPQDIWNALIEGIESQSHLAPAAVRPHLPRMATLSNVPRVQKKFINFARNSLNLRNEATLEQLWTFLDQLRGKKEDDSAPPAAEPAPAHSSTAAASSVEPVNTPAVAEVQAEEKKQKKDRKRKREEDDSAPAVSSIATSEENGEERKKKKQKKDKKEKKSKKEKSRDE